MVGRTEMIRVFKWLVGVPVAVGLIVGLLIVGLLVVGDTDESGSSDTGRRRAEDADPTTQIWQTLKLVDSFGDSTNNTIAASGAVLSIPRMDWPYSTRTATLFVDCDRAWIRFSDTMNLTDADYSGGQVSYPVRFRVGRVEFHTTAVNPSMAPNDLNVRDSRQVISAVSAVSAVSAASGQTLDVLIPQYQEGWVRFSWGLRGSSYAINRSCDPRR